MFRSSEIITIIRHKKAELDVWVSKLKEVEEKELKEKTEKLKNHVMKPIDNK